MKAGILFAVPVAAVSPDFESYKQTFHKHYATEQEETHAKECWSENVADILDRQAENGPTKFEENVFTDECWGEFAARRMPLDQMNGACTKGGVDPYPADGDETKAVDWRTAGYVNPVKDQGSCGSCWAFSTIAALEGAHFRATGELVSFSEQQLVSCDKSVNNGCSGGMPGEAMDYVAHNGIALESAYPYTAKDGSCQYQGGGAKFTGFRYIDNGNNQGEQKLLFAVQTEGPVSIVINANNAWQSYHGGILGSSSCPYTGGINHAVVAVGFGEENGSKYWLVRNSWGASWGESGYIRMAYGERACSLTACFSALPLASDEPVPPSPPVPPTPPPAPTPPPPPPAPTPPVPHFCSSHFDQGECEGDSEALDGTCQWCDLFHACFSANTLPSMCKSESVQV